MKLRIVLHDFFLPNLLVMIFGMHKFLFLLIHIPAEIKSRPSENFLVDFWTSALLKA